MLNQQTLVDTINAFRARGQVPGFWELHPKTLALFRPTDAWDGDQGTLMGYPVVEDDSAPQMMVYLRQEGETPYGREDS